MCLSVFVALKIDRLLLNSCLDLRRKYYLITQRSHQQRKQIFMNSSGLIPSENSQKKR